MNDIYIYFCKFPDGIKEAVSPCCDGGYTIWIDETLDDHQKRRALDHAMKHILNGDLEGDGDVDRIERRAHDE